VRALFEENKVLTCTYSALKSVTSVPDP